MNYARNAKYFSKQSIAGPVIMIILGALAALIGLGSMGGNGGGAGLVFLLIAVALIGFGILIIRNQIKGRVSDEEIDRVVSDKANEIQKYALSKLNVDPSEVASVDPVFVYGYDFNDATLFKRGKDGKYRTNVGEVVVIFFSDDVLHAYKEQFSLTNSTYVGTETHTYFYKDVVSISTATGKVDTVIGKVSYDEFRLTTSGGTTVGCSIRDQQLSERSIQGAKTLVMEKKRA